jgi:hypothetical protein
LHFCPGQVLDYDFPPTYAFCTAGILNSSHHV